MVSQHILRRQSKADMIIATCHKAFLDELREDKGLDLDWLISSVCIQFGAGKRYVKEIIKDLENIKKIKIMDGKVYYVG